MFDANWGKISGNLVKECGLTGVKVFDGIGTHIVSDNIVNAPSRLSATEYGIAADNCNVTNNTVIFANGETHKALHNYSGSMFINNAVKGDSANFENAWLYENEIIASNAITDRLFSASKSSVGVTPVNVANLASTSGGFSNYIFDVEVESLGNNRNSRYLINARGYASSWSSADLVIINEPSGNAAKITMSIVGANIVISGTQNQTATLNVSVSSKNNKFILTAL